MLTSLYYNKDVIFRNYTLNNEIWLSNKYIKTKEN